MAMNIAKGALFQDPQIKDGKAHPLMHIALEVLGVKLNLAVWPQETSKGGTVYWPVTGEYSQREVRRLIDVTPVQGAAQDKAQTSAAPATSAAPELRQDPESLPF